MRDVRYLEEPSGRREEMSPADVRKAFEGIGKLDAVRLSGGEPFVRSDLGDVLHSIDIASSPRIVHITTNGILTGRIVDFMESVEHPERVHLKVSIDAIGERNDVIRGVPGAFESAMDTLDRLASIRKRLGFVLGVDQTIIDRRGGEDAKELRKRCDSYGIGLYQALGYDNHVSLYSKGEHLPVSYERINADFTREELSGLLKDMQSGVRMESFNEKLSKRYYLKGMRNRMIVGRASPNPPCVELSSHIRLLPNGDIPICLIHNTIVGNAIRDDFRTLWHSPEIGRHRKTVKDCEGCWAGCESIPSAIYTGDIVRGLLP